MHTAAAVCTAGSTDRGYCSCQANKARGEARQATQAPTHRGSPCGTMQRSRWCALALPTLMLPAESPGPPTSRRIYNSPPKAKPNAHGRARASRGRFCRLPLASLTLPLALATIRRALRPTPKLPACIPMCAVLSRGFSCCSRRRQASRSCCAVDRAVSPAWLDKTACNTLRTKLKTWRGGAGARFQVGGASIFAAAAALCIPAPCPRQLLCPL